MRKIPGLIFLMGLCLTFAACGSKQAATTTDVHENSPPAASATTETPTDTTDASPTSTQSLAHEREYMAVAYSDALENLIKNHKLPDGTDAAEPTGDMALNKFALVDVDNDGKEELLLMYNNTYMAGQVGYVLGYDTETKTLKTELREFPFLTFYDNGIIKAGWSHNQGLAGDNFWPYSLYQYSAKTDSYELVGMVDAWDKNYQGTSEPFPADIDKSGTGYVYYIMKDGQYDTSHPVDAAEYNAWINAYIGKASELQIKYMDLTEENVLQIRKGL